MSGGPSVGRSWPLGATVEGGGANFSLFSRHATGVEATLRAHLSGDQVYRIHRVWDVLNLEAWLRPRLIWLHLALCAWALIQLTGIVECPLTALENWGRRGAGAHALAPGGFIDTYIEGVVYPDQYIWHVRIVAFVIVLHRPKTPAASW